MRSVYARARRAGEARRRRHTRTRAEGEGPIPEGRALAGGARSKRRQGGAHPSPPALRSPNDPAAAQVWCWMTCPGLAWAGQGRKGRPHPPEARRPGRPLRAAHRRPRTRAGASERAAQGASPPSSVVFSLRARSAGVAECWFQQVWGRGHVGPALAWARIPRGLGPGHGAGGEERQREPLNSTLSPAAPLLLSAVFSLALSISVSPSAPPGRRWRCGPPGGRSAGPR